MVSHTINILKFDEKNKWFFHWSTGAIGIKANLRKRRNGKPYKHSFQLGWLYSCGSSLQLLRECITFTFTTLFLLKSYTLNSTLYDFKIQFSVLYCWQPFHRWIAQTNFFLVLEVQRFWINAKNNWQILKSTLETETVGICKDILNSKEFYFKRCLFKYFKKMC